MVLTVSFVELCITAVALVLGIYYLKNKKPSRYPPGPRALPFVGNLFQLGKDPLVAISKWAKEYGSVFSFKMGNEDMVVVSDYKLIKEIFSTHAGSGRSQNALVLEIAGGENYGVANAEGAQWEETRRFTLRKLRDFGFGKTSMEGLLLEEVNTFMGWIAKQNGKAFTGNRIFTGAIVSNLWNIISGERYDWDTEKPPEVLENIRELVDAINYATASGLFFAPPLRYIAPDYFGWTWWKSSVAKVSEFTLRAIKNHTAKLNPDSPQDLIDYFLVEINKTTDENSSFYKRVGEKNLEAVAFDLLAAGTETTSNTLSWGLQYLSQHVDVQTKMKEELDSVVAPGHQPSVTNRHSLPYCEAVIWEILRISNILPFGVMHRTLMDTTLNGFVIPKGTAIMSNLYDVLHDPSSWDDAKTFKPERFIGKNGKLEKPDVFIPFSIGRRVCPGEGLARDTIFLFLTSLVQKYTIIPDPDAQNTKIEYEPGFLRSPKHFKIVAKLRADVI